MTKALAFLVGLALAYATSASAAQVTDPLTVTIVPANGVSTPQWVVAHNDGCFQVSGTTTDYSCQLRWRDSFTGDNFVYHLGWRPSSGTTPVSITSVGFKNSAATCAVIPGTYASENVNGIAVANYLCGPLARPASAFDINFASAAQLVEVATTELYGCTNPCVAEGGNASVTTSANSTMGIALSSPTTAANDLVLSFAYGPSSTFSAQSGTLINNAAYGVASLLTQYQIAVTPGTYAISFTNSNSNYSVLQNIVAFKRNPTPTAAVPTLMGQQTFTAMDTQAAGSAVSGSVYAYDNTNFSLIFAPIALSVNPGGLLAFDPATKVLTLARALTPADVGTYPGQLSVTQGGTTLNEAISLVVEAPRSYAAAASSNCDGPGNPPPAALRAGLTKRVYCLDPASSYYQTLTNWITTDDAHLTPPGMEWYSGWPSLTARDLSFPSDPGGSGRTVLQTHWHSTDDINYMRSVGSTASYVVMQTVPNMLQGTPPQVPTTWMPIANSYWEMRMSAGPLQTDNIGVNFAPDIFAWATCPSWSTNCNDPNTWTELELDFTEQSGPRPGQGSSNVHYWNNVSFNYSANNVSPGDSALFPQIEPTWSPTQMHTYSTLITTDNVSEVKISSQLDDIAIPQLLSPFGRAAAGVSLNPYDLGVLGSWNALGTDGTSIFKQMNYWVWWWGGTYGLNTPDCQTSNPATSSCVAEGGQPDQFEYVDHIEGWSCPDYLTNPECVGESKGLAQ